MRTLLLTVADTAIRRCALRRTATFGGRRSEATGFAADRALRLATHDVHVQFLPDKIESNDLLTGVAVHDLDLGESLEGGRYHFDGPSSSTTVAPSLPPCG